MSESSVEILPPPWVVDDEHFPSGKLPRLPRGPIWTRSAQVKPSWAIPWERTGMTRAGASTYVTLIRDQLPPDINGLRIARLTFSTSVSFQPVFDNATGWRVLQDGNPYDETWGTLKMHGFQSTPFSIECNIVIEPGATVEVGLFNSVSILDAFALAQGWYF